VVSCATHDQWNTTTASPVLALACSLGLGMYSQAKATTYSYASQVMKHQKSNFLFRVDKYSTG